MKYWKIVDYDNKNPKGHPLTKKLVNTRKCHRHTTHTSQVNIFWKIKRKNKEKHLIANNGHGFNKN